MRGTFYLATINARTRMKVGDSIILTSPDDVWFAKGTVMALSAGETSMSVVFRGSWKKDEPPADELVGLELLVIGTPLDIPSSSRTERWAAKRDVQDSRVYRQVPDAIRQAAS